ncbi:TetR family transcriptional regulator [Mycolicibacterium anyangense]|nr:TetR family transcriptional regulator [Mycolicibacterium anyangense]
MAEVGDLRHRRRQATELEISTVALAMFAANGFDNTTVEAIAAAAGVSIRTFHRYFRTKADAIAPILDNIWRTCIQAFADTDPDAPLIESLVDAFTLAADGEFSERYREFLLTLPNSPQLEPTWLRIHADSQRALRPLLAARLDMQPDDPTADFLSSVVISAFRVALQAHHDDPDVSEFALARDFLSLLRPCLE